MDVASRNVRSSGINVAPLECPFSADADQALKETLTRIHSLYDEGKRAFIVLTHIDPDADAVASSIEVADVIRKELPEDIQIVFMHHGTLADEYKGFPEYNPLAASTLPEMLRKPGALEKTALVLTDHHELWRGLPPQVLNDSAVQALGVHIILDHHESKLTILGPGKLVYPDAGSTTSIAMRLNQLADESKQTAVLDQAESFDLLTMRQSSRLLPSVHVAGLKLAAVLIDAGIDLSTPERGEDLGAPAGVRWSVSCLRHHVKPDALKRYDFSNVRFPAMLTEAIASRNLGWVTLGDATFEVVASFIGIHTSRKSIAIQADRLHSVGMQHLTTGKGLVASVIFGFVRPALDPGKQDLLAGEMIEASIRTSPGIPIDTFAKYLAPSASGFPCGEGLPGKGGACWALEHDVSRRMIHTFVDGCMDRIRANLSKVRVSGPGFKS